MATRRCINDCTKKLSPFYLKPNTMNKLIFLMLLCMYSSGSEAHKMGAQQVADTNAVAHVAEPLELFNPFLLCLN